jgi:hypothetical protein
VIYRPKAAGPVEIYGLGQWRVGEESTIPYRWKKALEAQGKENLINPVTQGFHLERTPYHEQLYNTH